MTFYDQVSSHAFRPLILQPSRVSSNYATLIDNIFTNNVECFSKGGNIASSISDHFMQFSQIYIFDKNDKYHKKTEKYSRNWSIFNKREFEFVMPITMIINKSLHEGVFPQSLKEALVVSIFKKGDQTKSANYRPISLLSNISKIFERVMYNRI